VGGTTIPARAGSLAATIVPSSRRSSTRRISPGPARDAISCWRAARDALVGPLAASRSRSWSVWFRTARTVAESLATIVFRVPAEKWSETRMACAVAVIPMIARKAPKTRMRSSGRRVRGREPNSFDPPRGRNPEGTERTEGRPHPP
jgi:hypothetical protein